MGRIQANTGLVTGIDIQGTVDKLIALQAQPRDVATGRLKTLTDKQTAVGDLTAAVIAIQLAARNLGKAELFRQTTLTSSNTGLLAAAISPGGSPVPGSYQFTPIRLAQAQHELSQGFASKTSALGSGTLTFRDGGSLSSPLALSGLNGGEGVERGKIRITDRSGATATIDLRHAGTIDDVLAAINSNESISVIASSVGDRIQLTDNTGQSVANLRVQEVGTGATAAGLGLASINTASSTVLGNDVVRLYDGLSLSALRDGSGLTFNSSLADLRVNFRDGSSALDIDFPAEDQTVGDLLETLNAADPARLQAQLSADGERIELIDLTSGGGNFSVESLFGGSLAEELGLASSTTGSTLSGVRLLGGLNTTLLRSLNGGQGFAPLGAIDITDRSGATASVDLSSAETVDDVLFAINNAGLGVRAELNGAKNGIRLVDTTGATASNLIVADGDATNTATKLGLVVDAAVNVKASGDWHRQVVSRQTLLSSFNHGKGVRLGSIQLTDSSGASSAVNLTTLGAETIGDVIDAVNNLSIGVEARINDTGDGIVLVDTAAGAGKLKVIDVGTGHAAADLKIAGESVTTTINGQPAEVIDGSSTVRIELDGDDTLEDLVTKINDAGVGLSASIFNNGTSTPYQLSLLNSQTGVKAAWVIDGSGLGLNFQEITAAQDALVAVGPALLLVSSATNVVDDAIAGIRVTLLGTSTEPVTVTVSEDLAGISGKVKAFVDQYNKLIEKLDKYDFFQTESGEKGVLFGSSETRRIKSDLAELLSGRFTGSSLQSMGALGVGFKDDGTLEFSEAKFNAAYNDDATAVEEFFSDATSGFSKRIDDVVEALAGVDNSVLINRTIALQAQVEQLSARIERMGFQLELSKERLLLQFYRLETTIGKLQSTFGAIQNSLNNAVNLYDNLNSRN